MTDEMNTADKIGHLEQGNNQITENPQITVEPMTPSHPASLFRDENEVNKEVHAHLTSNQHNASSEPEKGRASDEIQSKGNHESAERQKPEKDSNIAPEIQHVQEVFNALPEGAQSYVKEVRTITSIGHDKEETKVTESVHVVTISTIEEVTNSSQATDSKSQNQIIEQNQTPKFEKDGDVTIMEEVVTIREPERDVQKRVSPQKQASQDKAQPQEIDMTEEPEIQKDQKQASNHYQASTGVHDDHPKGSHDQNHESLSTRPRHSTAATHATIIIDEEREGEPRKVVVENITLIEPPIQTTFVGTPAMTVPEPTPALRTPSTTLTEMPVEGAPQFN
jgi:hypothetical protein